MMNFKQQLKNIYLTWAAVLIFHFTVMFFKADIRLFFINANTDMVYVIQTVLNVITIIVGLYALYILVLMIKHLSSRISMMGQGSVVVADKEYNGVRASGISAGKGILVFIINIIGICLIAELLTGAHIAAHIGSGDPDNRNQAFIYLGMAVMTMFYIDTAAAARFIAHVKEKALMKKRFNVIEININTLSKTDNINDVSAVIHDFKQIAADGIILRKLEKIESQIHLFNQKKAAFESLFRMKELDWEKRIRESLGEIEKSIANNCHNMLFNIKSLEGAYLQDASLGVSEDVLNEIEESFNENIEANNTMFDDINAMFAQASKTYNKVSTAGGSDADSTVKAMDMMAKMNDTAATPARRNVNRIIDEMYRADNGDKN